MKPFLPIFIAFLCLCNIRVIAQWRMAQGHIATPWAEEVNPQNAWPEYPRPNMVRPDWKNLNGLWSYAILQKDLGRPEQWQGEILVPFAVESALSGVQQKVGADQKLWYKTQFDVPASWQKRNVLLHFEAVDWECRLWINGHEAGTHRGGYDPFSFDITEWLVAGKNELILSVFDPTDAGWQPVGKQTLRPGGIFYTSVTGIWQTVWLEPVAKTHVTDYKTLPDIDKGQLTIVPELSQVIENDQVVAEAFFGKKKVGSASAKAGEKLVLQVPNARLWAPGNPQLYDLKLRITRGGRVVDEVSGYFGMRKVSLGKDTDGFMKIFINNKFVFQNGPLDQGFWPDGVYTAPNETAMRYDLEMIRKMGFNMLRKHVKVEPRRFYYWCDRMGLLVWQDMPNGDRKINPDDPDIVRTEESARQFEFELKQLIERHFNHPSIVMWVPFNEGWGQYETPRIVEYVRQIDPTRLVNNTSGWSDRGVGDVLDWHHYPEPACPPAEEKRAIVLGEFGGLGLKTEGHMWETGNWGYANYGDREAMLRDYEKYYAEVFDFQAKRGLSAAIYTQITDVETEANGLMTYDRRVSKAEPADLNAINTGRFVAAPTLEPFGGLMRIGDTITLNGKPGADIRYTTDGSEPTQKSARYSSPVRIEKNFTLRARSFADGKSSRVATADFFATEKPKPVYLAPYSRKYRAGGDYALTDGKTGSTNFADGVWQGFSGNDLEVVIEMQQPAEISTVRMNFLQNTDVWIFLPRKFEVFTSKDGLTYEKAGETAVEDTEGQPRAQRPARIASSSLLFSPRQAKFIKVRAENPGKCPEWHPGKGQPCWIFADEITME